MKTDLTERQETIVDFIKTFTRTHGHPPTVTEVTHGLGLRSVGSVHHHLVNLRHKKVITWEPKQARTLKVR